MRNAAIATLLLSLLPTCTLTAQDGPKRDVEVTINGLAKDTVYLANYYGSKLYYSDTAVADAKGKVVFHSARGYKAGVYAVVVPGPKYFEVILNEPVVKLATDTTDLLGKLVVKASKENQVFLDYIRFLNEKKKESDILRGQMEAVKDPIAKGNFKAGLEQFDKDVKAYQKALIAQNPGLLAASLVKIGMSVELPEIRKADGSLDSAAAYYQFRQHFWDNVDLKDERIVRVPVFANKFDEYIGKTIPQVPDTINKLVDELIARTDGSNDVFRYMVNTVTHKYETSDIMGMDAVFVHMALTYYCPDGNRPGRADWIPQDKLTKLCERAHKQAPLVIGAKAPYLSLTDTSEQKWVNFYDLQQEYVVIIFWDPHCGHCKKELPEFAKLYHEKMKAEGIEVFCVAKATDDELMKDWKAFIRENDLDWVNVGLTKNVFEEAKKDARKFIPKYTTIESLNYADTYDVYATPKVFLVDGERKFRGKQLSPDQIVDLVKQLKLIKEKRSKG
ncbi:MAG: redoxin domain-containing protein [Flavobacteriales bacterium]|nr:redoxin domain-containing protein [Flavobacteriales bacterium]